MLKPLISHFGSNDLYTVRIIYKSAALVTLQPNLFFGRSGAKVCL